MKIKFNNKLDFQLEAIESIVDIFDGQPIENGVFTVENFSAQMAMTEINQGVSNKLVIPKEDVLENVRRIQLKNGLKQSEKLGDLDFSIEMETGTGKTYVYLRTIMELNKKYGFKKFIIVVPSVAIKEGVYKSLEMTEEDFKGLYKGVPYEYFDYDSDNLEEVRNFATSSNIQIMIINIQAFNKNFTKKGLSNIIHRTQDKLSGNKPIELIAETNPIVIVDEPQSVISTNNAKKAVKSLNPLCLLRYSATHKEKINLMYKLDAIDAHDRKLVKQIEVASITAEDDSNRPYIKLISVNNKKSPITARIELEVLDKGKTKKKAITVRQNDDLYRLSNGRDVYSGFIINDIYCEEGNEYIDFTSQPDIIYIGQSIGGVDDDIIKRAQIRMTIEEHLEKELRLNRQGVKVLSLFFIDKVENYRIYNSDASTSNGKYAQWFEEEYRTLIKKPKYRSILLNLIGETEDLDGILSDHISASHNGYFAQDKKGRIKDSKTGNSKDDEDTYSLIMKDKEKLLSFDSKLRFIFSHSALKEGWDNPNVFQICTLNETKSVTKKRQEIGRGLRLAVKQDGNRTSGFDINTLTVMANESYDDFARGLQKEYEEDAGIKFGFIEKHSFANIKHEEYGEEKFIGEDMSRDIFTHLLEKDYLDEKGKATRRLQVDLKENLFTLDQKFKDVEEEIKIILNKMVSGIKIKDHNDKRVVEPRKEVILSEDFKELWDSIKYKTRYSVSIDRNKLVKECALAINKNVLVDRAKIIKTKAISDISQAGITVKEDGRTPEVIDVEYDRLPDIITILQNQTDLTRRSIAEILDKSDTLHQFRINPQKYIEEVAGVINRKKKLMLVDGIKYTRIGDESYSCQELFLDKELTGYLSKNLYEAKKSTHDYVVYDSGVERSFAESFENNDLVKLYTKLPAAFKINTPLGSYNPDWAILVDDSGNEKLYFVVETKGSVKTEDLRATEDGKIKCGREHFKALNTNVEFEAYDSTSKLIDQMHAKLAE